MKRAYSVKDMMRKKYRTFPFEGKWEAAFGHPETTGVWLIWGNSGNGKSSFVMQLCKELVRHERVLYDSLEEGTGLTMMESLKRHGMDETGCRLTLVSETAEELSARLRQKKSPNVVVIDSIQYLGAKFDDIRRLKQLHPGKLFIFVSQAISGNPAGSVAVKTTYEASLKIMVEGFIAYSKGRFFGPKGRYIVWEQGAERYYQRKIEEL